MIDIQDIDTLKTFYRLMDHTQTVRSVIVKQLACHQTVGNKQIRALKNAQTSLKRCIKKDYIADLILDGSVSIEVDLRYEITELEKDIYFLENGKTPFLSYLQTLHPDFFSFVKTGVNRLQGKHFNCFITDRDGTINNYCGRYRSSIQSAYNALFLTRFATTCTDNPIIITSAPLKDVGLIDVSTMPPQTIIYAASKGREFVDLSGVRRTFPIDAKKQRLIALLNRRLEALVAETAYERFSLIGSGLQLKFGQTTIARQDINRSISKERSHAFLSLIKRMVKALDPKDENFKIEDTGLDIEIILTFPGEDGVSKDFDKKEAVRFLEQELELKLTKGPHLICGDTHSDLPMLKAAVEKSPDTWSVFVTKDPELARQVEAICPKALIVPEPDMLITILGRLADG